MIRDLARRLRHLDERLGAAADSLARRSRSGAAASSGDAPRDDVEATLAQLVRDSRALHDQLAAMADACEGTGTVEADDLPPSSQHRLPPDASAPGLLRPRAVAAARWAADVVRRLRWALLRAPDDAVILTVGGRAGDPPPRLCVLVTGDAEPAAELTRARSILASQTVAPEVVYWNSEMAVAATAPDTARAAQDRAQILELVSSEFLVEVHDPAELAPGFCEEVGWLLASERLTFALVGPVGREGERPLLVIHREAWRSPRWPRGSSHRRRVVGKAVTPARPGYLDHVTPPPLRWMGPWAVAPRRSTGTVRHVVRPFAPATVAAPSPVAPASLLLVTAPATGGAETLAAAALQALVRRGPTIVVGTESRASLGARRLGALSAVTPRVFLPDGLLAPEVLASWLVTLLGSNDVATVVHLGADELLYRLLPELVRTRPGLRVIDHPLDGTSRSCSAASGHITRWLASSSLEAGELVAAGADDARVTVAPLGPVTTMLHDSLARAEVRATLGVPDDAALVVMVADLVPDQRPEDFVAVAHRCRRHPKLWFALAGEGPLAGPVADTARLLPSNRLHLLPPSWAGRLLAACDIACSTAEAQPYPWFPAAAVAAGVPLAAPRAGVFADLLDAAGASSAAVPWAGDVEAMAAAVVRAVDLPRRPGASGLLPGVDLEAWYRRMVAEGTSGTGE